MPRDVFNWTFSDIVVFLKKHKFTQSHVSGSHYFYVGHNGGQPRIACVPFHGSRALRPKTFKGIVRQSGISIKEWLDN